MKARTFGLDIGSASMKALWLGEHNSRVVLESVVSAPATPRGVLSESLIDQQKFAQYVRNILDKANITTSYVNISIPENQVYSKVLEMPELSEKELSIALQFEMEQYIPLPLPEVRTDFEVLSHREKDGRKFMDVLVVGAPIKILERYEKILNLCGLKIESIETEVLSVFRAVSPILSQNSSDIIVQIGASSTNIAILKNKIMHTVFSISLGGSAITRAVSVDLGIEMSQAESFKKAYGFTESVFEGKIGRALSPILDSIAQDIRRGVLSYKERNPEEQIKQLILSGGSALLPGIDVFFTNALDTQVVIGNCWQVYGVENVPEQVAAEAPSYNVVAGLALRDLIK